MASFNAAVLAAAVASQWQAALDPNRWSHFPPILHDPGGGAGCLVLLGEEVFLPQVPEAATKSSRLWQFRPDGRMMDLVRQMIMLKLRIDWTILLFFDSTQPTPVQIFWFKGLGFA